jgi:hypothetical protein
VVEKEWRRDFRSCCSTVNMWNEGRWTRVCILCFWFCITKHIVKPTKTESHRTWTFFQFQTGFHLTETPALDKIYFTVCNPYIYCQNHVVHVNGVTLSCGHQQPQTRMYEYGEQRWNGIDGENSEILLQCYFVHNKFYMDWPGCEPGLLRWEASN